MENIYTYIYIEYLYTIGKNLISLHRSGEVLAQSTTKSILFGAEEPSGK